MSTGIYSLTPEPVGNVAEYLYIYIVDLNLRL